MLGTHDAAEEPGTRRRHKGTDSDQLFSIKTLHLYVFQVVNNQTVFT